MKHTNFEDKLAGIVEMDDAYIGGKKSGGKRGRGAPGKTPIVGMKSRGGDIMAFVVATLKADTLEKLIRDSVSTEAEMLITDELKSYKKAAKGYMHETVKHSETFVNGNVHTMGVENMWSLFKRAIIGIYHRVSSKFCKLILTNLSSGSTIDTMKISLRWSWKTVSLRYVMIGPLQGDT